MESLPAIDCSIVCELFINDLLGILANSTATHIYGSLLHVAAGIVYLHFCARSPGLESSFKTLLNNLRCY